MFFAILAGGSLFIFVFSLWTHQWVYLIGGRKGFIQTLHVILCSMTPNLLLGWIPLAGMFASIRTLILMFFGIWEFQEISDGRAVAVILISMVVPVVVLIVLFIVTLLYPAMVANLVSPSP